MTKKITLGGELRPPAPNHVPSSKEEEFFQRSRVKLAIQKDGELTALAFSILSQRLQRELSPDKIFGNYLYANLKKEDIGLLSVRNKSICQLVAKGSVDAAIVGLDQVYESGLDEELIILQELQDIAQWDIVLATSAKKHFEHIQEIQRIATQYPVIATAYFASISHFPQIIQTHGSTEIMPLLQYENQQIDGIVDLRATGETLKRHGLLTWNPAITKVYPVIVANKNSWLNLEKQTALRKLFIS